jgi:hypothetical protein
LIAILSEEIYFKKEIFIWIPRIWKFIKITSYIIDMVGVILFIKNIILLIILVFIS